MTHDVWIRIADQLGEVHGGPRGLVRHLVRVIGPEVAQATADEAVAIEAAGGMLLPDGVTRRTVGGIFFRLIRDRLTPEEAAQLPPKLAPRKPGQENQAAPPTPAASPASGSPAPPEPTLPTFKWAERQAVFDDLREQKGNATTVKITLIGRPGRIVEKQDLVITMMQQMKAPSGFPKGVPAPPSTPTTYTVYIAKKQWNKVADAIQNPDDALIIEGFVAFDPSLEGLAVFTSNVGTKLQQAAKRQAPPAAPSESSGP